MFIAYVVLAILTAALNTYAAVGDFLRTEQAVANMTRLGMSQSWLVTLGGLKVAGALGLLAGIWLPLIGVAAATGLVLYFAGAVISHMRAHWYGPIAFPSAFLLLAAASLVLRLGVA